MRMDRHNCVWIKVPKKKIEQWCDKCYELKQTNFRANCENYPACLTERVIIVDSEYQCLMCDQRVDTIVKHNERARVPM
jgi:hypothetical protein